SNHLIVAEVEGFEANSPPWERRGGCGQGGFAIFFLMGTGARGGSFKRNCFGVGTNHSVRAFQRNGDISGWRGHPSFAKEGSLDHPDAIKCVCFPGSRNPRL